MRVISGNHKGRQLKAVPGTSTRPTTDKVKEAVFQRIGPYFDGGSVLDLFAGSGSLGIEALSRGMESAIFVDKHPQAIHTIKHNLETLKLTGQAEVFRADAYRALKASAKRGLQFELILLDPPYSKFDYLKVIESILALNLIKKDGIIYCEHDPSEQLSMGDDRLQLLKQENYGGTIGISIYQMN
ncbi:16S rRNA (guanine(966)-N(2))-methyltransferase RsmD [Oceanobacillus bengalensis]|uniref:16S rRNA (Guanine(966)-N(2))-methyltransferase RsmD n=1 Tax=Oceanobacillus bengalensis TaxID=1435466 RepID=A0A494Z1H5_9BACI|nr:16S rRNA (guanine(966)-N(2))-methyltransferase RsmD [Oceanobacillus bengalensis]RKQ16325.1 16S rRNA (guanine(966)-N(2))-methyltransferase RsmD [Oceanobacillus bengalensis]